MSETSASKAKAVDYASDHHRFGVAMVTSLGCSGNACGDISTEYDSAWILTNNGGKRVAVHAQNAFMGGAWDATLSPGESATIPFQMVVVPFNANYA